MIRNLTYTKLDAIKVQFLHSTHVNQVDNNDCKKAMAKNFGLSQEDFNALRAELINGDETLFKHIFFAHFEDCRRFLINKYSCSSEDAYDATMNTLVVFRKKIIEEQIDYNNLRYLFTRMAGQDLMVEYKNRKRQRSIILEEEESNTEYEKKMTALEKAFEKLGEGCKKLLKSYYYDKIPLKEQAEITDTAYVNLRKKKERCMTHLRTLVMQYSNDYRTTD